MYYLCVVYDDYAPDGAKVLLPAGQMGLHETIEPMPMWAPMAARDHGWHQSLVARDAGDVALFVRFYGRKRRRLCFN